MSESPTPRVIKFIAYPFIVLLILIFCLLLALPTFLSSDANRERALTFINDQIPGKVDVSSAEIGWFSEQKLKDVQLKDPDGMVVFEAKEIQFSHGLFKTLITRGQQSITVLSPKFILELDEDGKSSIERVFQEKKEKPPKDSIVEAPSSPPKQKAAKRRRPFAQPPIDLYIVDGSFSFESTETPPIFFEDIKIDLESRPRNSELRLLAEAYTIHCKDKGWVKVDITTSRDQRFQSFANIDIKNFPSRFIDKFLQRHQEVATDPFDRVFGPNLNVVLSYSQDEDIGTLSLDINDKTLNVNTSIQKIDAHRIKILNPLSIQLPIDPDMLAAFRISKKEKLPIKNAFTLKFSIEPSEVDLRPEYLLDNSIEGLVEIDQLVLADTKEHLPLHLETIKAPWKLKGCDDKASVEVTGMASIGASARKGDFSILACVGDWSRGRKISLASPSFKLDVKASDVPVILPPSPDNPIPAIFGDNVSLEGMIDLYQAKGPFSFQLSSPNCNANGSGVITNSTIYFNEPFVADLRVTEQLGKTFLKNVNPILVTAISSKQPIRLTVDKEGFALPLTDFSFPKLSVPSATFELGQITMGNGDVLGLLVGLLKTGKLQGNRTMDVWFTPLYFSIQDGVITDKRMDALIADSFHIATWGSIDSVNKQLDFRLGLGAHTLRNAFGLKKIDKDDMVVLPLTGSTRSPKLRYEKALADISRLVLEEQAAQQSGLLEGLIDMVKGDKGFDRNIPPPTTDPLPWEGQVEELDPPQTNGQAEDPAKPSKKPKIKIKTKDVIDFMKKKF